MKKKLNSKRGIAASAIFMTIILLTGCASNTSEMKEYNFASADTAGAEMAAEYEEAPYEESYDMVMPTQTGETLTEGNGGSTQSPENAAANRKLIRTVDLETETEQFDIMIANVENKIQQLGGYIESEYTYNGSAYGYNSNARYANITIRVPDDKLDEFVTDMQEKSNIVSKTTSTEDVTLQYVDVESRKEMYLAQQESLLALLEKAESVEDIAYLTEQLANVRYNIESMESTLRTYDNLVDYATINLNIQEVEVLTPTVAQEKSIGQQLGEGFVASMKDVGSSLLRFGMNIVINLPYIIRFLVIVAIIFFAIKLIIVIIKKYVKKKKAKRAALKQSKEQNGESNGENKGNI